MKSTLDYDVRYSQDEVDFLDCKVRIRNGQFQTELCTKDTDAHLYLLSSSCHPKHTINAIPKGQFIRIRRICSDLELYWKHSKEYIKFFAEKGYNLQKLQDVAKEISKVDREGLLHYKSKPSPVSKILKDLFTQWHPQISKLSFILKKHKDILTGSPELSQCFPEAPKVMYRRKRSIKDILRKSDIAPNPGSGKTKVQNHPCGHGNCILCPSFSKSNVITNRQNGHKFNMSQCRTCRTKNIIYDAECVRHKKIYIGQSKNQLNKRFCGHRYDIKKALNNPNSTDIGGTELSDHFAKTPHGAGDLRVRVLNSSEK